MRLFIPYKHKYLITFSVFLLVVAEIYAQEQDSNVVHRLEEVVISLSVKEKKILQTIPSVDVLTSNDLLHTPQHSTADALQTTGKIFVQKSQAGGGSPVLRGFEANKVLIMIDGIRVNTTIFKCL